MLILGHPQQMQRHCRLCNYRHTHFHHNLHLGHESFSEITETVSTNSLTHSLTHSSSLLHPSLAARHPHSPFLLYSSLLIAHRQRHLQRFPLDYFVGSTEGRLQKRGTKVTSIPSSSLFVDLNGFPFDRCTTQL